MITGRMNVVTRRPQAGDNERFVTGVHEPLHCGPAIHHWSVHHVFFPSSFWLINTATC